MRTMRLSILLLAILACCTALFAQTDKKDDNKGKRKWFGMMSVVSPEVKGDSVTFRVLAPNAQKVTMNGSWMGFMQQEAMVKESKGIWSVTVDKPYPDIHTYTFNIDGLTIPDPNNFLQMRDVRAFKSVLYVRGGKSDAYDCTAKHHGKLIKAWYNSTAYGIQRRISIYTPYGYDEGKEEYPVLYLQHGGGGDEDAWPTQGRACEIMDYMIENNLCKPMIVVMPNSMPIIPASSEVVLPDKWIEDMSSKDFMEGLCYVKSIYTDIIPYVESNYRVKKEKSARAIAGLSMGGIYTLNVTQQKPELFDYIGVLSMGTTPDKKAIEQLTPVKDAGYKLYWVGCGKTDMAYSNAVRLMEGLDQMKMPYTYYGEVGGHSWDSWRKCLLEFAPKLFK